MTMLDCGYDTFRGIDVAIFVMGDTVKKTNLGLMMDSRVTNHKL